MITGSIFSVAFTLRYDQSLLHYLPFDEGRADCMQAAPPLEPETICRVIDLTANSYYKEK